MTKREQMLTAIEKQKKAVASQEPDLSAKPKKCPTCAGAPAPGKTHDAYPGGWSTCETCGGSCVAPTTKAAPPPRERHPNDKLKARQRGHVQVAKGRLPHGSRFEATYDAAKERWYGTLSLYGGSVAEVFAADSKGVWRLMERLDDLYREHLKAQTTTPEAT